VSSLLAGGLTLDEIPYWRDGTLEKYTPSGDYVVHQVSPAGPSRNSRAPGPARHTDARGREVMSIGKTYKEALQKSIRFAGRRGTPGSGPGVWEVGVPTSGPETRHSAPTARTISQELHDDRPAASVTPAFTVPARWQLPQLRFWHWWNFGGNISAV